ncbi:hypothetical protein AN958_10668 [Leucoagaricus sp. SymC.cos]|nr:hypothetical protein AN958_10668 [Leucoagaricus sp. SymC.cos]
MATSQPGSPAQSRQPSQERGPQLQAQQKQNRGRSRSSRRRSPSVASTISDSAAEDASTPPGASARSRRGKKRKGRRGGLPAVDEVESTGREVINTAQGAVDTVGDTGGAVAGGGGDGGGGDKPLKLRLDLNLDVDIRLTAKVHGDVTLSLL